MSTKKISKPTDPKITARREAQRRLNENHATELRALMHQTHEELGLEYHPRLTPEERAVEDARRLIEEYPAVRQALSEGTIG